MQQRRTSLPDQRSQTGKLVGPARCAGDGGDAELNQPLQVADDGIGPGKLDGHVRAGQALTRQGAATGVLHAIDYRMDDVTALRSQTRDGFAHLTVADYGDAHERPVARPQTSDPRRLV